MEETRKVDGMAFLTWGRGGSIANSIDDMHTLQPRFISKKQRMGGGIFVLVHA